MITLHLTLDTQQLAFLDNTLRKNFKRYPAGLASYVNYVLNSLILMDTLQKPLLNPIVVAQQNANNKTSLSKQTPLLDQTICAFHINPKDVLPIAPELVTELDNTLHNQSYWTFSKIVNYALIQLLINQQTTFTIPAQFDQLFTSLIKNYSLNLQLAQQKLANTNN